MTVNTKIEGTVKAGSVEEAKRQARQSALGKSPVHWDSELQEIVLRGDATVYVMPQCGFDGMQGLIEHYNVASFDYVVLIDEEDLD